ncbi:hypothetical protein [Azotobacter beijerinckii]|uniref:Uncharacterized protein n=1 Tax=Azotobacter beijerinckii TaxID=170623 RepID=A0A1I4FEA2_9GAMM|nr:hypothetical protein [Azotobacter beijerinckii]SFB65270.1 hypothetical protein SAMN04244571_04797 [Azotobacter beijerinckii]SFL15156.1 hypothetical protein SAMN04244574_03302 [Azotobacter beijerinckii]
MRISRQLSNHLLRFSFFLLVAFALGGCTVKLVADYDSVTFEEILKVGKKVDKFYGDLLETKPGDRTYQKFSAQYVEIETDIRSLVTRNIARALNEESTQISEITLNLWVKYKGAHKTKDTYSDGTAKLDRNRFTRLFAAAASAERAKNLDADDKDVTKDSK